MLESHVETISRVEYPTKTKGGDDGLELVPKAK